ncbi:hypothetical protein [Nocardioides bigeumensis]
MLLLAVALAAAVPPDDASGLAAPRGRGDVHIFKLGEKVAPHGGRVRIKPPVEWWGNARVQRKSMTVTIGARNVATDVGSVRLGPGKYQLKTKVKYQTWKLVPHVFVLPPGSVVRLNSTTGNDVIRVTFSGCRVTSVTDVTQSSGTLTYGCYFLGWNKVTQEEFVFPVMPVQGTYQPGQFSDQVLEHFLGGQYAGFVSSTNPQDLIDEDTALDQLTLPLELSTEYQAPGNVKTHRDSRSQSLVVRAGVKPRKCATYADFRAVNFDFSEPEKYGDSMGQVADTLRSAGKRISFTDYGDYVIEFREYRACDENASLRVGFVDGRAYAKSYST